MPIRHATLDDFQAATYIQGATLGEEHPYFYARNIGVAGITNLVSVVDGQVVGFVSVLHRAWDPRGQHMWQRMGPYVGFVGVLPEFQGQGLGPGLLRQAQQELLALGIDSPVWLECEPESPQQRSHARAGFALVDAAEVERLFGLRPKGAVMRCA